METIEIETPVKPSDLKALEAYRMHCEGFTFEEIASKIGYAGPQGAQAAYRKGVRLTIGDTVEVEKSLDLSRIEIMMKALMRSAKHGQAEAVDRMVKLQARKAALLGLDSPVKLAPTNPDGTEPYQSLTDSERAARTAAIYERARQARAGSAAGDPDAVDSAAGPADSASEL